MLASYNNADKEQHLSTDDGNSIYGDSDRSKDLFCSARHDQIRICLDFFLWDDLQQRCEMHGLFVASVICVNKVAEGHDCRGFISCMRH